MGQSFTRRWNVPGDGREMPGLVFPHSPDRVFPLAARSTTGALANSASGDSLGFEKQGFARASKALTSSEAAMEVMLVREPIQVLIVDGSQAWLFMLWAGETTPNAVRDVSFQTTLLRATEWLARKEVLYPVPVVFNTETKVVFRDLELD